MSRNARSTRAAAPRLAQRGEPSWFSCDAMSRCRLSYAKHFAKAVLNVDASHSTVIRRALEAYQVHLEKLLPAVDVELTSTQQRKQDTERYRLLTANRGDTSSVPTETLTALPVRPLKALLEEYRAAQPTLMDRINADLRRWSGEPTEDQGIANDHF